MKFQEEKRKNVKPGVTYALKDLQKYAVIFKSVEAMKQVME
jgi:hypothetical protein